jgi:hypothetical protein
MTSPGVSATARAHTRVSDVEREEPVGTAAGEVRVRIEKTRRHRAAAQIDASGRRAGELCDLSVAADGRDGVSGDRDRLRDAIGCVDGDDSAVIEDQIGGRGRIHETDGAHGQSGKSDEKKTMAHAKP